MFRLPKICLLFLAAFSVAAPVVAQDATRPPVSGQPIPSRLELSKLIWSTMAAVDHANQSGNYSVLRDMASPAFQGNNDPASLAIVFAGLRSSKIDLSNALLLAPTYRATPAIQNGVLTIKGSFGLRPTALNFDFQYQWSRGKWRLFNIAINEGNIAAVQPQAAPASR